MSETSAAPVGRRLREIRLWRRLALRAVAELAGFSASYLSLIERGERPVDKRSTLEALAAARTFLPRIEEALTDIEVGGGDATEPWPAIGRRLATSKSTRDEAITALLRAEELARTPCLWAQPCTTETPDHAGQRCPGVE